MHFEFYYCNIKERRVQFQREIKTILGRKYDQLLSVCYWNCTKMTKEILINHRKVGVRNASERISTD